MDSRNLAQRLARLSPAKRALLELQLNGRPLEVKNSLTIPRRPNRDQAPLSFAQRRLWFLNQLEPDNPNYNESSALRLSGPLDNAALQNALDRIVARHEVLRATIDNQDGDAVQRFRQSAPVELEIVDLRETYGHEREAAAQRRLVEAIRRPFDLTVDLMLRPLLVRLDEREHILLLVIHHIASDAWSVNIVWRELCEFYRAETLATATRVAELPIQYQDYSDWQLKWFSEQQVQAQLTFWKSQLEGLQTLRLPTDRPVPSERQWRGARMTQSIDLNLRESIAALSRAQGVTQFMILLAAFQALLHRYSGQADIAIGTPIAGRNRTETEGLIGFFINTLVLRTDLSANPSFAELLGRVRDVALNAYSNQDIPFEKLVEELNPQRSLSQTPLFNILFAAHSLATPSSELPGLSQRPYEVFNGAAKCDFYLSVITRETGLTLRAEYDAELFEPATVERMLRHYRTLLETLVADPAVRIDDAALLSAAEKHQMLIEWNDTQTDYPSGQCLHQLFEAQVDKTPDALALVAGDQQLTYRQLNSEANHLARRLHKLGIGPAASVGLCMESSSEFIIGVLAILKTGGAYVPLDPSYPQERLRFMIEDAQVKALLTRDIGAASFADIEVVAIKLGANKDLPDDQNNLAGSSNSNGTAYVIYTSGSTGLPKGVSVSHQAVIRLVVQTDYVEIAPTDVIAQVSNVSFDAATFEIWGALLNGACVVVTDKQTLLAADAFASLIAARKITTLFLTTALFNQMTEQIPQALGSLKYLLFGGEMASPQKITAFLATDPQCRLVHVYGPTETTTFATSYRLNTLPAQASAVPIGKPIANTTCYILDASMNPVPINVAGELYIGGPGVANEYWNRPELTAERFIANPFSDHRDERLYRTGDLARYRADGNIEFVGRSDNQIKLRGFRIELGEIEAVMRQHTGVEEAAVIVREDQPGDQRLIAYFVARSNAFSSASLLAYLQAKLPGYMMPGAFVQLPRLPLNANGKLDRPALPQPTVQEPDKIAAETSPRTAKEILVREIWTEVLKAQPHSIHDNFFEVGGHSLLGMALIARLQKEFQRPIPVRWLFESPSVAGFAARLEAAEHNSEAPAANRRHYLFELKPGNGKPPVFLLPGGFGGDEAYLYYARLAYHVGADYPFYGLRARSAEGEIAAHRRIQDMARDYLDEIRSLQAHGPYSLMGNCIGGALAYEIASQVQAAGEDSNLILLDSVCPNWKSYWRYVLQEYGRRVDRFFRDHRRDLSMRLRRASVPADAPPGGKAHGRRIRHIQRRQESYVQTLRAYRPKPYKGHVSLIYNENAYAIDPLGGWSNLISGDVNSYRAPGDHETYIREHVQSLAKLVRQCLEKRNGNHNEG